MNKDSLNLSKYRVEKAKEDLSTAMENLANKRLSGAINRSYYCIFDTMRAVLALDGFDSKKHSGVISYFRHNYIKTNIFDRIYSEIIGMAFEIRNKNDYDDFVIIDICEANTQVDNAKIFLGVLEAYLENRWNCMCEEDR
jgi:uncharacterized protein (UPF0332 family)